MLINRPPVDLKSPMMRHVRKEELAVEAISGLRIDPVKYRHEVTS
jgi:hypothetical protein